MAAITQQTHQVIAWCEHRHDQAADAEAECDDINTQLQSEENRKAIASITIQRMVRGYMLRMKRLPLIMYSVQEYLRSEIINFSTIHEDGRINSCIDEEKIVKVLIKKFGKRIRKSPKARMWYDILVFDYRCGWLPVNLKTTTTLTSDNTGNLAMCVYAYTNAVLDINSTKTYDNGKMSELLFSKLSSREYNLRSKKDYYFLVLNKTKLGDVVVNSVRGLSVLTPNINNLPFQVCWNKNRLFEYKPIRERVDMFIRCLQKPRPSWKEIFMVNMRTLTLD